MTKKVYGTCALCGKEGLLTFEHVPPECTFNKQRVKVIKGEALVNQLKSGRKPWNPDFSQGKIQQKGSGGYYLCKQCNSATGSWYIPYYKRFVMGVACIIQEYELELDTLTSVCIEFKEFRPMPIIKEILTLFCDINHGTFGDDSLQGYLLDKDRIEGFDTKKYRVFCYISKGPLDKANGLSVSVIKIGTNEMMCICLSEITSYPLGFTLYIDLPDGYTPEGVEITEFAQYNYNDVVTCKMMIPALESNTIFPGDHRSKSMINATIEINEKRRHLHDQP